MGILSLILWSPAAGALLLSLLPHDRVGLIRGIAASTALVAMLLSWSLALFFDVNSSAMQFAESFPWNPELGSTYALGLDGFSLPMLMLGTLLMPIAMIASVRQTNRIKGYHICLLLLQFGIEGVFLARDWALFYVFWEVTLIPLFFLIDQWGGVKRHTASLNFVLYTMGGSVFMLIALLVVYAGSDAHSTSMDAMSTAAASLSRDEQIFIMAGLLIGFGVKLPIFPLHGWLPLAHVEAPSPVSILLSGVLLKMGAYGLLRGIGMLPLAAQALQGIFAFLALVSIFYGALLAWRQSDLKAMIAYSSISHMGLVMLGISSLNEIGLMGATLQMSFHGLIAGALFLLVGLLYERTHTREITAYSSLIRQAPRFAVFTSIALLAGMGLPGTAGFVAEVHAIVGGIARWGWWMWPMIVSILVSAAYAIRTVGRLFTGPSADGGKPLMDLQGHELTAASTLALGIVGLGLVPAPLISLVSTSVGGLIAQISGFTPP